MHVEDVLAIAIEEADALLILKKTKLPLRKVKQRADAGVGLAVVVAERTLVISTQLRYAVVGGERPVVAEGLVHFELHGLVLTFWIPVSVRFSIGVELPAKRRAAASLALGKVGAVLQEDKFWIGRTGGHRRIKAGVGHRPRRRVHRRETRASGRWTRRGLRGIEAIRLIEGYEGRREIVAVNASGWVAHGHQRRCVRGRRISLVCCNCRLEAGGVSDHSEDLLVRIDEDILRCVGIADEVVEAATIEGQRVELLDGDTALVFNDALEPAVNVADAGHDAASELVIVSHEELVGILHAGSRCERFASADQSTPRNGNSARRIVEKMS